MDNLEEMEKIFRKVQSPKRLYLLQQEEIENMNRPITSIEIKSVI